MKTNQKGFSVVEILIIVVIVGLMGAVGWSVYDRQNNRSGSATGDTNTQISQQEKSVEESKQKSTAYSFKELGISMDILDGWEVKTNHTQVEGVNFYNWTVEKPGADGWISLDSSGFRGGFYSCAETGDSLTAVTVKDVASTQNENLMFMSWSYDYNNETKNITGIVLTNETVFWTTNDSSASAIANKDVKPGNYFFCLSEPGPGFSLNLNDEAATGFSRVDHISAFAGESTNNNYVPLLANAESYQDIKTMLTTIR